MEIMKRVGILLIIVVMVLSNGWIEIIHAEGFKVNNGQDIHSLDIEDEAFETDDELEETKLTEETLDKDEDSSETIETEVDQVEIEENKVNQDEDSVEEAEVKTDKNTEVDKDTEVDNLPDKIEITKDLKVPAKLELFNNQPRKHLFAGYDFSGVVMEDGSIWTWGANGLGQLGLDDRENRLHPVKMNHGLENHEIVKILSGSQNTIALTSTGDVYVWGQNVQGIGNYNSPTKLTLRFKVKDITWLMQGGDGGPPLNNNHSNYALLGDDGRVYTVGSTFQAQNGRGLTSYGSHGLCSRTYNYTPGNTKPVLTNATVTNCADGSGYKQSTGTPLENIKLIQNVYYKGYVAVNEDNEVYSWGTGMGTTTAYKNPNAGVIEGDIIELTATGSEIFALTDKNEVWKWTGRADVPVKETINNVKSMASYGNTMTLVTHDGKLYGKGDNSHGQLGDGSSSISNFTLIENDVNQITLGYRHSLIETTGGKIFGQGWNGYRQLANEDDGVKERFVKVPSLSNVTKISAEYINSYAIKNGRELFAWGGLNGGDLGSPTNTPRKIRTFESDVVKMASNRTSTVNNTGLILDNDKIYSWGHGNTGSLGHSTTGYKIMELKHMPNNAAYTPNTVDGRTYVVKDKIGNTEEDITAKDFVLGGAGGAAVNKRGQLLTWGRAESGLWGIGETHYRNGGAQGTIPKFSTAYIKAKSNEKFTKVAGNHLTRLALQEEGYVYSWGANSHLALGRTGSIMLPQRIPGLSNIVDIHLGYMTGMALDDKGNLYTWGNNTEGQVGNGTVGDGRGVVNISGLSGLKFERIFSGATSMFAVTENGDLYAWGDNRYGQLGLGGRFNRTAPRKVEGLPSPVVDVDNGSEHTLVALANGDVYSAGADTYGQLGLGAEPTKITNQEIPFPDYITLQTKDNQEKDIGGELIIDGYITSIIPGNPLEVRYEIESSSGIVERGKIKDMTSSSTSSNYFTKTIILDNKYPFGGYTVNIIVLNKTSGLENTQTISFGVTDSIPPTSPKINVDNEEWTKDDVAVTIVEGIDRESGVDYTEYRINNGEWGRYRGQFIISDEGLNEIETRTADKAGNISPSTKSTVKIDKSAPVVDITADITNDTHKNITLTVNASDNLSGVKNITYLGDNMIKNGDFKDGLDHWHEDKPASNPIGGGDIALRNGYLYLADNRVTINKAEQRDAFTDTAVGAKFYALAEARGEGLINARYAVTTGPRQTEYTQELISDTEFNQYKFGITRGHSARDVFMIERASKEGWIEIRNVEVYAEKDITDTGKLEVASNGEYRFIIEDHVGNIAVKSFKVDNIVRELTLEGPEITPNIDVNLQENIDAEIEVGNLKITDWRDNNNDWKLSLQATQLNNADNSLPKGTLSFKGVKSINKIDGDKSGSLVNLNNEVVIDDGAIEVLNATNERGIYDVKFKDNALKLNLTQDIMKGIYNTKLEWTLNSTPEVN